jgi:hypothetical protein
MIRKEINKENDPAKAPQEKRDGKDDPWSDDPTDIENHMEKPGSEDINIEKNVFDRKHASDFGGINTHESVFARGTLFHVTPDESTE